MAKTTQDDSNNLFGSRLKALREAAGLTQAELAVRAGMVQQALARYEAGGNLPGWEVATKLADALGVSLDEFRQVDPHAAESTVSLPPRPMGKRK